MPMNSQTLGDAIKDAGCPVAFTRVIDGNDRSTWSFDPDPSATQAQKDAGNNVIATIPVDALDTAVEPDAFISRFTNAEYLALEKKRRDDIAANKVGNAKNWDQVVSGGAIDMNKKKTQTLKTDLVTDGILTQVRADEIFK